MGWSLPECDAQHVIDAALEIGLNDITWQEIEAYRNTVGLNLTPWDMRALNIIKRGYNGAINEYSGTSKPAPWSGYKIDQDLIAEQTRRAMLS